MSTNFVFSKAIGSTLHSIHSAASPPILVPMLSVSENGTQFFTRANDTCNVFFCYYTGSLQVRIHPGRVMETSSTLRCAHQTHFTITFFNTLKYDHEGIQIYGLTTIFGPRGTTPYPWITGSFKSDTTFYSNRYLVHQDVSGMMPSVQLEASSRL